MVQSLLEDRKTMTRRLCKPLIGATGVEDVYHRPDGLYIGTHLKVGDGVGITPPFRCPYGKLGDILWVRESFAIMGTDVVRGNEGEIIEEHPQYVFRGQKQPHIEKLYKWKPSIHMPLHACRLFLKITSVGVERLHDITAQDIQAEGVRYPVHQGSPIFKAAKDGAADFMPEGFMLKDAPPITEDMLMHAHWAELWCSINGRESWDSNPWVWVIAFERIEKPES